MSDAVDWLTTFLATEATTAPRLAGYYHHNYIVSHQGRPVVVRVPIAGGQGHFLFQARAHFGWGMIVRLPWS